MAIRITPLSLILISLESSHPRQMQDRWSNGCIRSVIREQAMPTQSAVASLWLPGDQFLLRTPQDHVLWPSISRIGNLCYPSWRQVRAHMVAKLHCEAGVVQGRCQTRYLLYLLFLTQQRAFLCEQMCWRACRGMCKVAFWRSPCM